VANVSNSANRSLTGRLVAYLAITGLVVSAIAGAAMYRVLSDAASRSLQQRADETLSYLVGTLEASLWAVDDDVVRAIGAAVSRDELIARLVIRNEAGTVIFSMERAREPGMVERESRIVVRQAGANRDVGEVFVALTPKIFLAGNQRLLLSASLIIFAILIALAVAVAILVRYALKEPLSSLNQITERFADGHYDIAGAGLPYREFQTFGRALAQMANTIKEQIAAIREAEGKYRSIFENAREGMFQTTMRGHFLQANPALAEILGYATADELLTGGGDIGESIYVQPMERDNLLALLHEQGGANGFEVQLRRKDGKIIWASISARLVRDVSGQAFLIEGFLADITERKRTEDALRLSSERLQLATRVASIGIWDWDIPKNELLWDESMYKLYGLRRGDFGGAYDAWMCTVHPEDKAHTDGEIQAALRGEREYAPEFRIVRPDGTIRHIKADSRTFKDQHGKPLRMIGTNIDITERKQSEEDLRHYKDQLEETVQRRTAELMLARDAAEAANKAKSVFLANMSHELRTPLNAILGFSSMMKREPQLTDAQRANIDIINRSGTHLLTLINDVLEIAKIEAGRLQLEIAPFDLGAMVRDVAEMMQLRAREKGLRLLLDMSSQVPRYIKGDEARLRQILINLLGNAVKFTEQGGVTVCVGVHKNDRLLLLIEVEDSGPGISEEDQERIFRPFVQLAESGEQKGTGLGLTITKQFVELMKGAISLESTVGKGSLFRVKLPVEVVETEELPRPEVAAGDKIVGLAPGQPAYRVLIVEDQHENQLLLNWLMSDIGIEARLAENGEQCVKIFEEWHPDLIWMDRRMPVMDGEEATRRVRRLPGGEKVKIVAVTASAFREEQQEMLDAGMDDFVRKPYRPEEIYDCLARQLGVRYIYQDAVEVPTASVVPTSEMMAVLPGTLRDELKVAVESLDSDRIAGAIRQVGEYDKNLQKLLAQLADDFSYPDILKALKTG
jgi:PAS domain S-box-containing protein